MFSIDRIVMKNSQEEWEVPQFKTDEFFEKKHKYCICIFVINEGDKLKKQLKKMKEFSKIIDIVVADGGSSDNSTEYGLLKNLNVNTLLTKKGPGKLGTQMRMAFSWLLQRGYAGTIVIDGNGKDGVEAIPEFISKLEQGYDCIQGSRFLDGGYHENTPLYRLIALKLIHVPLMRWISGFKYTDTTNGFRAYSSKILSDSKISVFRNIFTSYELHYYLAVRGPQLGFKCTEIPVQRIYPKGRIPTKISPIRGSFDVFSRLIRVLLGRYNPRQVLSSKD